MSDLAGISRASIGIKRLRSKKHQGLLRVESTGQEEHRSLTARRRQAEEGMRDVYDESQASYDLIAAVEQDDLDAIEDAVRLGSPVNGRTRHSQYSGQTPLACAIRLGHLRSTRRLLMEGADPFIQDDRGRDSWYYCCFGRRIKEGEHKLFMTACLEATPIDAKVMLMAMHSAHPGVRYAALEALPSEITSRDSKNRCSFRFGNLGALDDVCPSARIRWPDGSLSPKGLTAFQRMTKGLATESVAHPSTQALIWWKWKKFVRACFLQDILVYLISLASISAVGIVFPFRLVEPDVYRGLAVFMLAGNILMASQETLFATLSCVDARSFWPLVGRPLHAFISCLLAFVFFAMSSSVIFTWLRMLYFIRLLKGFGSFCIILVEMIKRDVTKFCLLLAGILPGFLIAIHMMILTSCSEQLLEDYQSSRWLGPGELLSNLIFMVFGVISWDGPLHECLDRPVVVVAMMLFLLMTAIVLLNLMIAMFADTYNRIQTQAQHQWALNIAMYIHEKELLLRVLPFRSWDSSINIAAGQDGWKYACEGRYEVYFLPQIRGDAADRPEEYIMEMIHDMWQDMNTKHADMQEQLSRLSPRVGQAAVAKAGRNQGAVGLQSNPSAEIGTWVSPPPGNTPASARARQ